MLNSGTGCPGGLPNKVGGGREMGALYQRSALHKSLPLSMGGSCASDYIKKFAVSE